MESLKFDLSKDGGKFKILNAVNNGPCHKRHANDQYRTNFETYKAARIPYARNHDAAYCAIYGGEHTVDITAIFPNFDADAYDPASYDFAITDEYVQVTLDAGTKTFFRLGQKIEHWVKKFGILPPKDFKKWAVVCEHIIRHYTEGWADGFDAGIEYWEIWNEADLDPDDSTNKRTWGGTKAEFFRLYEITAKHLKSCFPQLKVGGPALAYNEEWAEDFLRCMRDHDVAIDFFSWHIYCVTPQQMMEKAARIKALCAKYGYGDAESILNEWNYVKGWEEDFIPSIETIIGVKGAAFTMACMAESQRSSIDMLMYYDARPTAFNGLFDLYTFRPLKGYYPFLWYGMLYDAECEIVCDTNIEDVYTLCGRFAENKAAAIITYYTEEEGMEPKTFTVDFGKSGEYEIYRVDETHSGELCEVTGELTLTMEPNSILLIKEK